MNSTGETKFKTFLALPFYGVDPVFVQCLISLISSNMQELGIKALETNIGDSSPTRARNTLTHRFLASECDQICLLDSDILFTPQQLKQVCSHRELMVGGFYAKKQQGPGALVCNTFSEVQPIRADGLQKVKYMGGGCLVIKRAVFEIMIAKHGEKMVFHPDETAPETKMYAFWQETPYEYPDGSRRFLTEDWRFCQMCLDLGIDVWADTQIVLGHRGPVVFPLESQKETIYGLVPVSALPSRLHPPVEASGGAVTLPEGFKYPQEAVDDANEIIRGSYDLPLKEAPKTVLDAGAHVGLFLQWAVSRWQGCKIDAFEPSEENFRALTQNLCCRHPEVTVHHAALFNHNSELKLRKGKNSLCHSANATLANGPEFTVRCVDAKTLPSYDFIKIDTEGSEIPILSALDLTNTKAVVLEAHSEDDRIVIRQSLERMGFSCYEDVKTLDNARRIKMARPEALLT